MLNDRDDTLIASLYDAVIDESRWAQALREIMEYCQGTGLAFIETDSNGSIVQCDSVDVDPEFNRLYLEHYAAEDPRLAPALRCPVGQVTAGHVLVPESILEKTEIYADLLRPADVPHMMMAWIERAPRAAKCIAIQRSQRVGQFDNSAQDRYSRILPHVIRAAKLRDMLFQCRRARNAYEELLERLPFGVVLLDDDGGVIEASAAAEKIFRRQLGLRCRARRVWAQHPDTDRRLQELIASCVRGNLSASADAVLVPHSGVGPGLTIRLLPVTDSRVSVVAAHPTALMLIFDPAHQPRASWQIVKAGLGLTEAEAQLAVALFESESLRDAADVMQISVNTCKTQLKSIYSKTGCGSHAELAKRVFFLMTVSSTERAAE